MLIGEITAENQAVVPIEVHGSGGQKTQLEAAIDTGYNGFLTLPRALIEELELPSAGPARAALGDGNEVRMEVFLGAVEPSFSRCRMASALPLPQPPPTSNPLAVSPLD